MAPLHLFVVDPLREIEVCNDDDFSSWTLRAVQITVADPLLKIFVYMRMDQRINRSPAPLVPA